MGNITDLTTSWEGYTKGDVEDIIKQEFARDKASIASKFGASYFDQDKMMQYFFATDDDKQQWLDSGDESLIVHSIPFNFSGTVNQVKVINEMASANLFFTTQSTEAKITCSFISQEKGITDSAWTDVNEDFEVSVMVDRGGSGSFATIVDKQSVLNGNSFTFDVRNSLATGANRVRVMVKGVQTESTASLTYTVTLTTMYLAPSNFAWYVPFVEGEAYSLGGMNIGGNLQKVLRIRVSREEAYLKEYEINIGDSIYTSTAYVFTGLEFPAAGSGVYNVELWLDANGLTSEHLSYNIICVKAEEKSTAQLVSVSDMPSSVLNFSENKLFEYCVYNKGLSTGSPTISLDTIVNTNKTNLKTETLVDVPTNRAISYSASLELEVVEAKMQLSATIDFGNAQQVIYHIDNSKSYPATSEAVLYINPAQRSNVQGNRDKIVNAINSVEYDAEWTGFSWGTTDGWVADKGGRMCLRVPAFSRVNIAHQPMADLRTPITMEFVYKVENASDYDDPIITICDDPANDKFTGIRITPKNICVHSRDLKDSSLQDYNTIDEQILDVIVTIVPNYKTNYGNLAQVYCNGVKVRSFEFTSIGEWNVTNNIILGSDTADLSLYKMRVYHKGFDKTDAMRNFINSLPDLASREAMYNRLLSVTDDSYNLSYDSCVRNGYNTMVIEMLGGKDIPSLLNQEEGLLCNLQINIHNLIEGELDEEMADLLSGVLMESQGIEGQGTTAMTYGRWNFRWKLSSAYGKRRITAKKNVASSMQSHKMGATRMFNYLHRRCVGANEANANVAVLQYPVYGFQKVLQDDGVTYMYRPIGLYTIGADKGDKHTFGYDQDEFAETLIHLEGSDHTPKSVGFDYPWKMTKYSSAKDVEAMGAVVQDGIVGAWEVGAAGEYETDSASDEANIQDMLNNEFKPAYDIAYNNSPYILCVEESLEEINANIEAWRDSVAPNGESYAAYEFFNKDLYNVIYYNEFAKRYEESGVNLLLDLNIAESAVSSLSLEETTAYIVNARKERFVRDWETYWHKDDAIFHYVFMLIFGATDNFKKNTYPYKFRSLTDGGKWRWRADDLDTIFDINNQGLAAKIYSILVGDKTSTGSGSIYRGDNSAFWTLIKETQQSAIKAMVHKIFNAMVEHPLAEGATTIDKLVGFIKYFFWDFAQAYFTASAYNADTEWTYEDIWANKNAWKEVNPLSQALGGHYEAEQDWVAMRMLFLASYYNYGPFVASGYADASTGQMVYGGAEAHTYEFTPSIDFNPTIIRGSTETITYGDRVKANTVARLTVSSSSGADTRVYVQGLDWIKDIGDLSSLTVSADNPTLNVASQRLQRLKIGDVDASVIPSAGTIKSLTLGDCPSMMSIDARNLSTLEGTIDLSSLDRLREAYFGGTNIKGVNLQDGSKIEALELPASITSLKLIGLKNLKSSVKEFSDFEFVQNYYIATNKSAGATVSFTPVSESNFTYAIIDCQNYEKFVISGTGGKTPRLWCFVDANNALISTAADTITVTDLELTPPGGAKKLILNFNKTKSYSAVGYKKAVRLNIESLSNVSDLRIENCEGIDGFELMKEAYYSYNSQLSSIRLIGFEREADANDLTMLANMVNDVNALKESHTFTGIDAEGRVTNHPVIEGTLIINTPIYREDEEVLKNAYGDALIIMANNGYYIKFEDDDVRDICATNWGDDTGITEAQAKSITNIGNKFYNNKIIETFEELKKFTGLAQIGDYGWTGTGFNGCTSLRKVSLPHTAKALCNACFNNTTSLESVEGLEYIESIGHSSYGGNTFYGSSIKEVSLSGLKTLIGHTNFKSSKIEIVHSLGSIVELPGSGSSISGQFTNCTNLRKIVLPETLERITGPCFYGCTLLSDCNFPASLKHIDVDAFQATSSLEVDVVLPNIETFERAFTASGIRSLDLTGSSVTTISSTSSSGLGAFANCKNLTRVIFNDGFKTIQDYSFGGCTSLQTVYFSDTIESIASRAFIDTAFQSEDVIIKGVQTMGAAVFKNCKMRSVILPSIITMAGSSSSGYGNFNGCTLLQYAVLGSGLTSMGVAEFGNCGRLYEFICLASTPPTIGSGNFSSTPIASGTGYIYVPDASVEAYKTATNWSTYMDRILPISTLPINNPELYEEIKEFL